MTPHGLRRGGATWAFDNNVDPEIIRRHGDWLSDAYLQYIDVDLKKRFQTMLIFEQNI